LFEGERLRGLRVEEVEACIDGEWGKVGVEEVEDLSLPKNPHFPDLIDIEEGNDDSIPSPPFCRWFEVEATGRLTLAMLSTRLS
jgi:hypothetical protein